MKLSKISRFRRGLVGKNFPPKLHELGSFFFLVNSCLDTVFKIDKIVAEMNRITAVSCCHDNLHVCDRTLLNCKG